MRIRFQMPDRAVALLGAIVALGAMILPSTVTMADLADSAKRHLVRSAQAQRDGSHLIRLSSLRVLRDPEMQPLFYGLLQHKEWQVQVHALLGLAEIDSDIGLDPLLVTQVDPLAREQAISTAIDLNLLHAEAMQKLLEWNRLETSNRLLLMAELQEAGEPIDLERLRELADDNDLLIAGVASLLLANGGDEAALSTISTRLKKATQTEREQVLQRMFDVVRIYEINAATLWLNDTLRRVDDDDLAYWGTFSLMTMNPELGKPHWNRILGDDPTYHQRVRAGLQLLEAGIPVDSSARKRLRADEDELIQRMAAASNAIAADSNVIETMEALIDTGHPQCIEWALRHAQVMPKEQSRTIYVYFINRLEASTRTARELDVRAQAISAMSNLTVLDADVASQLLLDSDDDSMKQQALLIGALQGHSPELVEAARPIRRIGSSRPDSLALLLLARDGSGLKDQDVQQLGRIAAGGSMLGEMLQAQAAWLYLKHTGELDEALVEVSGLN
jgi:HEAT repeat protein